MSKELIILLTEHETEHSEYMQKPKPYTKPKVSKGKRNYIYYSYVDPETGQMTKQKNIYLSAHRRFPNRIERLRYLNEKRKHLEKLLKDGWSPYANKMLVDPDLNVKTISEAFEYAMSIKKAIVAGSTFKGYKSKVKLFENWLLTQNIRHSDIRSVDKRIAKKYLNKVLTSTSPRNHNNTLTDLSAIFSVLASEDFIDVNFFSSIDKVKSSSKRDKTFTKSEMESIREEFKDIDHMMMLINLMYYCLWRSSEVVRLKVSDISLEDRRMTDKTKTKSHKTKIIPEIIFEDLKIYINSYPERKQDDFLITPKGVGVWIGNELARQRYYSRVFKKKTSEIGIKGKYSLNSIRHTAATEIFTSLRKDHGFNEALDRFILISGHESIKGALNYIHQLDAELPQEYSDLFS